MLHHFCLHQARVIPNNDKNRTYSVVYLPKVEGLHKVRSSHCKAERSTVVLMLLIRNTGP